MPDLTRFIDRNPVLLNEIRELAEMPSLESVGESEHITGYVGARFHIVGSAFSPSLGKGFRLGFLGLLHAQITQERLEREYDLDIIAASPSVNFVIDGKTINKPQEFDPTSKNVKEPYAKVTIFAPQNYYGAIAGLVHSRRGELLNFENIGNILKIQVSGICYRKRLLMK